MKHNVVVGGLILLAVGLNGCGEKEDSAAQNSPQYQKATSGSSAVTSGSTGVFTVEGVTYALTPGPTNPDEAKGATIKLLSFANTGPYVGASAVNTTYISTALKNISGIAVDPFNDIGVAYSYDESLISFYSLINESEIHKINLKVNQLAKFYGNSGYVVGAVMHPATKTAIIATGDGFIIFDYSDRNDIHKMLEIPSIALIGDDGIEVNENFAFHPALNVQGNRRDVILTGGRYPNSTVSNGNSLELIDASSGKIYRPDVKTRLLFSHDSYIDAISLDTNYHIAVLAPDDAAQEVLVDLNKLVLNDHDNTFSLPPEAIVIVAIPEVGYTNIAVDSANHIVFMGESYFGKGIIVGELKNPSSGLGFQRITSRVLRMPNSKDNLNQNVDWYGSRDPHGARVYVTPESHQTNPNASIGIWASGNGERIAVINLMNVLTGQLREKTEENFKYDALKSSPEDISYIAIPVQ